MIYETPSMDAPIRQGDIFVGVPRVDLSLREMLVANDDHSVEANSWNELAASDQPVSIVVPLRPVAGIVISQDCDALRVPDLSLCEIRPFQDVERKCAQTTSLSKWVSIITQQARLNQKWFYLPPSPEHNIPARMGVDFLVTLRVPREDLEAYRHLRSCRLNSIAGAHFRERIAEFFRRYPYDEWYPLDSEEFAAYQREYPDSKPYPWQRNRSD